MCANSGKPAVTNCVNDGSVGVIEKTKSREITRIFLSTNGSAPYVQLDIFGSKVNALFDTGAARSLLHVNVFKEIEKREDIEKNLNRKTEVELYDVHGKKLETPRGDFVTD